MLLFDIYDYERKITRQKLIPLHQHCHANVSMNNGGFDKSNQISSAAQIAGRSVSQIDGTGSKEAQLYQIYLRSTAEDQLRSDYVNTVKKTEPHLSNRNSINPNFLIQV